MREVGIDRHVYPLRMKRVGVAMYEFVFISVAAMGVIAGLCYVASAFED